MGIFFSTVVISARWAFCTFLGYFTCPSGSGVGAIDRSDPSKHVFDSYCILEVLRKIFMDRVWAIPPQKSAQNTVYPPPKDPRFQPYKDQRWGQKSSEKDSA